MAFNSNMETCESSDLVQVFPEICVVAVQFLAQKVKGQGHRLQNAPQHRSQMVKREDEEIPTDERNFEIAGRGRISC